MTRGATGGSARLPFNTPPYKLLIQRRHGDFSDKTEVCTAPFVAADTGPPHTATNTTYGAAPAQRQRPQKYSLQSAQIRLWCAARCATTHTTTARDCEHTATWLALRRRAARH